MRSEKRHVALAVLALVIALLACKHTYTPPGSTIDASVDTGALEPAPTGSCKPDVGNSKCAANDKAVWCKSRLVHDSPKASHWEGDWVTFTCKDCKKESQYTHIQCSDYAVGDPCDSFVADEMCTRDNLAAYRCEHTTNTWKLDACPGGCTYTPATRFIQCKE